MEDLIKNGWVNIFQSTDSFDAKLVQSKLENQGIEVVIFNHQDSMMTSLNSSQYGVSLFVKEKDVLKAKDLITTKN